MALWNETIRFLFMLMQDFFKMSAISQSPSYFIACTPTRLSNWILRFLSDASRSV